MAQASGSVCLFSHRSIWYRQSLQIFGDGVHGSRKGLNIAEASQNAVQNTDLAVAL